MSMSPDPWVASIQRFMAAASHQQGIDDGIKTLGEFRGLLRALPADAPVVTDGEGFPSPTTLGSYRGYYERLRISTEPTWRCGGTDYSGAEQPNETRLVGPPSEPITFNGYHIESGYDDVVIAQPCTVGEMLKALDLADGQPFEGYKGGAFTMHNNTFLHVAEYGECPPGDGVSRFEVNEEHGVVIITGAGEDY